MRFTGELEERLKPRFYGDAAATLFPSDWPEPFGLVMIESMAAGTPVIALQRGSVPESIIDGVTGYVCDTIDDMVDAVHHLHHIDPNACRRHAATFDVPTMAAAYEHVDHCGSQHRRQRTDQWRRPTKHGLSYRQVFESVRPINPAEGEREVEEVPVSLIG